jgi:hypothetical protein
VGSRHFGEEKKVIPLPRIKPQVLCCSFHPSNLSSLQVYANTKVEMVIK